MWADKILIQGYICKICAQTGAVSVFSIKQSLISQMLGDLLDILSPQLIRANLTPH